MVCLSELHYSMNSTCGNHYFFSGGKSSIIHICGSELASGKTLLDLNLFMLFITALCCNVLIMWNTALGTSMGLKSKNIKTGLLIRNCPSMHDVHRSCGDQRCVDLHASSRMTCLYWRQ